MKTYIRWAFVYDDEDVLEFWAEITEDAMIIFMNLINRMNSDIIGYVKLEQRRAEYLPRYEFYGNIKTISKVKILMNEKYG